ncbi:MAG: hypothetical protein MJY75_07765 [Bacteroidaceae bacterium]|nr:hypothetical protein [Bacteroidaceae bacterium]
MFKTQDFEKLWYRYKSEGEPNGLSIERYCMMNGVPYRQFEKWFRSTRQEIVPIQVDGAPEQEPTSALQDQPKDNTSQRHSNKILVIVRSTNGFKIQQSGLDYEGLKRFIAKLEGLC